MKIMWKRENFHKNKIFASRKDQNPQNARNHMNSLLKLVEIPPESPKIDFLHQNALFHSNATLGPKVRFGAKRRLSGAFSHFPGPGPRNTNLDLCFKL